MMASNEKDLKFFVISCNNRTKTDFADVNPYYYRTYYEASVSKEPM